MSKFKCVSKKGLLVMSLEAVSNKIDASNNISTNVEEIVRDIVDRFGTEEMEDISGAIELTKNLYINDDVISKLRKNIAMAIHTVAKNRSDLSTIDFDTINAAILFDDVKDSLVKIFDEKNSISKTGGIEQVTVKELEGYNTEHNSADDIKPINYVEKVDTSKVSNEKDIVKYYFDNNGTYYNEFVLFIKSKLSNSFIDQRDFNGTGLLFSDEHVKTVLTDMLLRDYSSALNPDTKYNKGTQEQKDMLFMNIFKKHFAIIANANIPFINIEGDIDYESDEPLGNVTVDNKIEGEKFEYGEENPSGDDQLAKPVEFFIESTPNLIPVSSLTEEQKIEYFGESDYSGIDFVQSKEKPFLTKADFNQLSYIYENKSNMNDEALLIDLENSGKPTALSIYHKFFSSKKVSYFDSFNNVRTMVGLDVLNGDTNKNISSMILSRLMTQSRDGFVMVNNDGTPFVKSVLRTDSEVAFQVSNSFNSIFDSEGKLVLPLKDNFYLKRIKGKELELGMNKSSVRVIISLDDITKLKEPGKKSFLNLPNSKLNISLDELNNSEKAADVISMMKLLGFDNRVASYTFITKNKDIITNMLANALYSTYINYKYEDRGDDALNDEFFVNKENLIENRRDGIGAGYLDHSSMMRDFKEDMINYIYDTVGVDSSAMIYFKDGTSANGIGQRKAMNVGENVRKDSVFVRNNIYSSEKNIAEYLDYNFIKDITINGDNKRYNDAKSEEKDIYLIENLFVGGLASSKKTMHIKAYTSERANREVHEVRPIKNAVKHNNGVIDRDAYIKDIIAVRADIINNTALMIRNKYIKEFDVSNTETINKLKYLDIDPNVLESLSEAFNNTLEDNSILNDVNIFITSLNNLSKNSDTELANEISNVVELLSNELNTFKSNHTDSEKRISIIINNFNDIASKYDDNNIANIISEYNKSRSSNNILNNTNRVIKSLPNLLGASESKAMDLLKLLDLSKGIYFNPSKLGLRESMLIEHRIYNDPKYAAEFIGKEFTIIKKGLSKYSISDKAIENLKKVTGISRGLKRKDYRDLLVNSYIYNNMLHGSALRALTLASLFQYKKDISNKRRNVIKGQEIKLYNKKNGTKIDLETDESELDNEIVKRIERRFYSESLNSSITEAYKRIGTLTSTKIAPRLKANGAKGSLLSENHPIIIAEDQTTVDPIIGDLSNSEDDVNDAGSVMNPQTKFLQKGSFGGQFDTYTDKNTIVKSSLFSNDVEDGEMTVVKQAEINIFSGSMPFITENTLLRKMGKIPFNTEEPNVGIEIMIPEVEYQVDIDSETDNGTIYSSVAVLTGREIPVVVKDLNDLYDYYGGYATTLYKEGDNGIEKVDVHYEVSKILSKEGITDKFVVLKVSPSARKTSIANINKASAVENAHDPLFVKTQPFKHYGIILNKGKDYEKAVTIPSQIAGVTNSANSKDQGGNIIDSFTALNYIGSKRLSDDITLTMYEMLENSVFGEHHGHINSLLESIGNKLSFDVLVKEFVKAEESNNTYKMDAIKKIYNVFLTKLVNENVKNDRNSDEVVRLVSGLSSNFNIKQIKNLSESLVRTKFYNKTLNIKMHGTETAMASAFNTIKLHKTANGVWTTKDRLSDFTNKLNSLSGIKSVDDVVLAKFNIGGTIYPIKGTIKQIQKQYKTLFQMENEIDAHELFNDDNVELFGTSNVSFTTMEYRSKNQLETLTDEAIVIYNGKPVYMSYLRDNDIIPDGAYIMVNNEFNDKTNTNELIVYRRDNELIEDDYHIRRINISEDLLDDQPMGNKYLVMFENGDIIYNDKIDDYLKNKGIEELNIVKFINNIDNSKNIQYYNFESKDGSINLKNLDSWKSAYYFENKGSDLNASIVTEDAYDLMDYDGKPSYDEYVKMGNSDRVAINKRIAILFPNKLKHEHIPESAFMTLATLFMTNGNVIEAKAMYDDYINLESISDKFDIEDKFTDIMSHFNIDTSKVDFAKNYNKTKKRISVFFRSLMKKDILSKDLKIVQPEILTPSFHYKSFGIPKGTRIIDILGDTTDNQEQFDNALVFFKKNVSDSDIPKIYKKHLGRRFDIEELKKDLVVFPNDKILQQLLEGSTSLSEKVFVSLQRKIKNRLRDMIATNRASNFKKTLDVIVTRIPLQSKQSVSYSIIKEFVWELDNTIFVSNGQYKVMGADNDGDTTNMMTYVFDDNNELFDYSRYISIDNNGKKRIPGFEHENLLDKILADPDNQEAIVKNYIENAAQKSTKLEEILANVEQEVRNRAMEERLSASETIKLINKAKEVEYNKFENGIKNFIIDNVKEIYTNIDNVFEIQNTMSSDTLSSILNEVNNSKESDVVRQKMGDENATIEHESIREMFDQRYTEDAIDAGGHSLGMIINTEGLVGRQTQFLSDRMLINPIDINFIDKTGKMVSIKSDGLFDSEIEKRNAFNNKTISYVFTQGDINSDENSVKESEEECS